MVRRAVLKLKKPSPGLIRRFVWQAASEPIDLYYGSAISNNFTDSLISGVGR
jgi:hypothetical protein